MLHSGHEEHVDVDEVEADEHTADELQVAIDAPEQPE